MKKSTINKIILACTMLMTASCSAAWQPKPITDVNNLHGLRVGANLSWEADYLLTGRSDLELYRYDTMPDMMMALNYDKIDALAADLILCQMIETTTTGVQRVQPAFTETGYVVYINNRRKDLEDSFNAFLEEYRKTDDYKDHLKREMEYNDLTFEPLDIPLTGTGETLIVAADATAYPRCFPALDDTRDDDRMIGFDTEALYMFANENNYQLKFVSCSYDNGVVGLKNDVYDMFVGYLSDAYRLEAEEQGILVSDPFDIAPVYFLQKTEPTITFEYDYFEEE